MSQLAADEELEEAGVVLSSLSIVNSPTTSKRFKVPDAPSSLLFLKKGHYHKYTGDLTSFDDVKTFLLSTHQSIPPLPTPPPARSLPFGYRDFEHLVSDMTRLNDEHGAIINVVCLLTGLFSMLIVAWALIKCTEEEPGEGEKKKN